MSIYKTVKNLWICLLGTGFIITLSWMWVLKETEDDHKQRSLTFQPPIAGMGVLSGPEKDIRKVNDKGFAVCEFPSLELVHISGCVRNTVPRPLEPLPFTPTSPCWQVTESNLSYGFSAYFDNRDEDQPMLRVIGVRQVNPTPPSTTCPCRLWYAGNPDPILVAGEIEVIPEGQYPYAFRAVIFQCPLLSRDIPYAVSIVTGPCDKSSNMFYVYHPLSETRPPKYSITCCIPPLHSNYDNVTELVEWIEAALLFGADHFIFYDFSPGTRIRNVLEKYKTDGLVEIIPWGTFPLRVSPYLREKGNAQILYFGQSAAINDCLYRTLGSSRYTTFIDTDEFIYPKVHSNWITLLNAALQNRSDFLEFLPGAYWVRNTFFDRYLPPDNMQDHGDDNTLNISVLKHMRSATLTKRRDFIWPYKIRTKYFVIPERVEQVGIHEVFKFRRGSFYVLVSPKLALMHHYRYVREDTDMDSYIRDYTAHRFLSDLVRRVSQRLSTLNILPGT